MLWWIVTNAAYLTIFGTDIAWVNPMPPHRRHGSFSLHMALDAMAVQRNMAYSIVLVLPAYPNLCAWRVNTKRPRYCSRILYVTVDNSKRSICSVILDIWIHTWWNHDLERLSSFFYLTVLFAYMKQLSNKHLCCRWYVTLRHPRDVTAMLWVEVANFQYHAWHLFFHKFMNLNGYQWLWYSVSLHSNWELNKHT